MRLTRSITAFALAAMSLAASFVRADVLYMQCDTKQRVRIIQFNKVAQDDTYYWHYRLTIFNQTKFVMVNEKNDNDTHEGAVIATPKEYILKFAAPSNDTAIVQLNSITLDRETGHYVSRYVFTMPGLEMTSSIDEDGECAVATATPKF